MSSANNRLNEVLLELPKYKSQWQSYVGNPYVRAYDLAVENYTRETKAQAERDRTMAALFVFGASILTGSVMMAAFATTSVRVLAGRAMLSVVCNRNLNRTFNLLHAGSTNKALMFALGNVLDEAKKVAGNQVKKAMETFAASAPVASAHTAINYKTRIEDFINANHICIHDLVQGVRDDKQISEAGKNRIADLTKSFPFCNPPAGRKVDEQRLSQKMELLFYMAMVLDSDRLVTYVPATGGTLGGSGRDMEFERRSIEQMPSAGDYPKAIHPRFTGKPLQPYEPGQRIEYDNIGASMRSRINTLSLAAGNGSFYPEQNMAARLFIDPTGSTQLVKAEQIISRLETEARPRQLAEVRMI